MAGAACSSPPPRTLRGCSVAAAAALLAAEVLHRRATARLGGTTGDVMGAMGEVATTAYLLVAAALWS